MEAQVGCTTGGAPAQAQFNATGVFQVCTVLGMACTGSILFSRRLPVSSHRYDENLKELCVAVYWRAPAAPRCTGSLAASFPLFLF